MLNATVVSAAGRQRGPRRPPPAGVALVEALVAIVIFFVGVLGLLAMQAEGALRERDALYRAEAAALAHEIIGTMWTNRVNLAGFSHRAAGAICDPSGSDATNADAQRWLSQFTTGTSPRYLPGATADSQQIVVDTSVTPTRVRVHLCWRSPQDDQPRVFVAVSQVP